jgi:hypothetical protein
MVWRSPHACVRASVPDIFFAETIDTSSATGEINSAANEAHHWNEAHHSQNAA